MHHMAVNKTTPHPLQHASSWNFDKIDSFLKPVLNIIVLRNVIAGWGEGVIKERAGILHQIYEFRGGVKSWGE